MIWKLSPAASSAGEACQIVHDWKGREVLVASELFSAQSAPLF
jgi:hypothetical protein